MFLDSNLQKPLQYINPASTWVGNKGVTLPFLPKISQKLSAKIAT
jgi:hypothetical protein